MTGDRGQPRNALRVAGCALGSALIYLLFLVYPYPLLRLYDVPLLDLGKLANYQPVAAGAFVIAYALVFVLYLSAYRAARQMDGVRDLWLVLGCTLVLCGILLWVYPLGANDMYDYIFRAREWVVYDYNPLVVRPDQLSADLWYPFVVWTWAASPYGPLWTYVSYALYRLAGDDWLRNLVAFKSLAVLSIVVCSSFIYALVRTRGKRTAVAVVLLFAWNPLLLFESVVNGHNDVLMMTGVLGALWLYARRRFTLALVAGVLAALVKVSALVVVPVLFVACVRAMRESGKGAGQAGAETTARQPQYSSRGFARVFTFGVSTVTLCLAISAVLYAPLWQGLETLGGLALHNERFTTSAAAIVKLALEASVGTAAAETWTRVLFVGLFVLAYVVMLRRTPTGEAALLEHLFNIFALLLIVGTLWFQPWYVVWIVALAPLAHARQRALAIAWSLGALSLYVLFDFVWVWYADLLNSGNELVVNVVATALWLGPVLGVLAWRGWRDWLGGIPVLARLRRTLRRRGEACLAPTPRA